MGCSCNKNTDSSYKYSSSKVKEPKRVEAGENKENIKVVVSGNSPAPKTRVLGVCDHLYDEIMQLDGKVYELFKATRFDNSGEDYEWLRVQRLIRTWKVELKDKCPDENDFSVVRDLINSEYYKLTAGDGG